MVKVRVSVTFEKFPHGQVVQAVTAVEHHTHRAWVRVKCKGVCVCVCVRVCVCECECEGEMRV